MGRGRRRMGPHNAPHGRVISDGAARLPVEFAL